jgi:hypothetical protein
MPACKTIETAVDAVDEKALKAPGRLLDVADAVD